MKDLRPSILLFFFLLPGVSCDFTVPQESTHERFVENPLGTHYVMSGSLYVRNSPGLNSKRLMLLPYGTRITVLDVGREETIGESTGNWYRIEEVDGWVFGAFVSKRKGKRGAKKLTLYDSADYSEPGCEDGCGTFFAATRLTLSDNKVIYRFEEGESSSTVYLGHGFYTLEDGQLVIMINREAFFESDPYSEDEEPTLKKADRVIKITYSFKKKKSVFWLNRKIVFPRAYHYTLSRKGSNFYLR